MSRCDMRIASGERCTEDDGHRGPHNIEVLAAAPAPGEAGEAREIAEWATEYAQHAISWTIFARDVEQRIAQALAARPAPDVRLGLCAHVGMADVDAMCLDCVRAALASAGPAPKATPIDITGDERGAKYLAPAPDVVGALRERLERFAGMLTGRDARIEEFREALRDADEIIAEPGTPPKSVWRAWQERHAEARALAAASTGAGAGASSKAGSGETA